MASPRKLKKADSTAPLKARDFDAQTQEALEEINNCQNEIEALNEQASEENLKVEQKFNQLRKPHFDERAEIIKQVPNFWPTAFNNHSKLSFFLGGEDDCFRHLIKLDVEVFEDIKSGYKINFYFEQNPYFENTVLTKQFQLGTEGALTSSSIPIRWKEGMDLTERNEPTCTKTGIKRQLDQGSFYAWYNWYNDHTNPTSDTIAEVIKDDLWCDPLQYFLLEEEGNGTDDEEDGDDAEKNDTEIPTPAEPNEGDQEIPVPDEEQPAE